MFDSQPGNAQKHFYSSQDHLAADVYPSREVLKIQRFCLHDQLTVNFPRSELPFKFLRSWLSLTSWRRTFFAARLIQALPGTQPPLLFNHEARQLAHY